MPRHLVCLTFDFDALSRALGACGASRTASLVVIRSTSGPPTKMKDMVVAPPNRKPQASTRRTARA